MNPHAACRAEDCIFLGVSQALAANAPMPLRSGDKKYINLHGLQHDRESTPWYWRLIALAASWMILGGWVPVTHLEALEMKAG